MIALMALDLPELERPAKATSAPTSAWKLLLTRRRKQEADIGKLAHGRLALESTHASVQFAAFQGARKTMIESRFSLSLAAAFVCAGLGIRQHRRRAQEAARRARPTPALPKAAVCTACHGVNGNSSNPEWPNLAGQNAAYMREQLAMFKARKAHQRNHVPDHRSS